MGDAFSEGRPEAGEWPVHQVTLPGLCLDATAVTNEQFAASAAGTGRITGAEEFGASAAFHLAHRGPAREVAGRVDGAPWWLVVEGAGRRRPDGFDSADRPDHPVVHVSWRDATAYAAWAG
ncbi:SUMF1/EgtB/PvdO family nonheme iron enzyme [Streptomyces sp. NPDC057486]|uniref:SUMF1/EgtB/PvdO family nonheme iron enzyme n=1 Tax=Streptomyces sp. NPDC057486 TaxID=3346145 RepID=UPI0036A711EA